MPAIEAAQQAMTSQRDKKKDTTMMMQWRGMCAGRWYNKEPSQLKDMLKIFESFWNRASC
jgi:hypothetical protein